LTHLSKADLTNNFKEIDDKWLVTATLERKDIEIIYLEWEFVSLANLLIYSNDYCFINKLLLIWIKYLSHSVYMLDDHIANAIKSINIKDNGIIRENFRNFA
jgi:hypothetical protein